MTKYEWYYVLDIISGDFPDDSINSVSIRENYIYVETNCRNIVYKITDKGMIKYEE